jgi:pyruvate formate lyase activating enzyme
VQARDNRCRTIAYTYSEPIVFYEYVMDAAEAGHREGVRSVMVSNGFIQQEPLRGLCDRLDAIKIDLKSYSEAYYRDVVRGALKPVLETIATARRRAKWLEVVYLVVPTLNDSDADFRNMARWMKSEIGTDVPVHFTRFYPLYLLKNLPPTPVPTLERAKAVADAEGLQFVYIGNVPGHKAENTYCPKCHELLIERTGYTISQMNLKKGMCKKCGHAIPGVWA